MLCKLHQDYNPLFKYKIVRLDRLNRVISQLTYFAEQPSRRLRTDLSRLVKNKSTSYVHYFKTLHRYINIGHSP